MPVLIARGAGVRRRRRWLFHDLDVTVEPGEVVAVVGPPGSGRTTLLLALAQRFRLSAGRVTVDGPAALGHVPDVSAPEPVFTVAEHVRERLALLGRSRRDADSVDLRGLDPETKGRDLTPYEKQVLGLVLAQLANPVVIALDGFEEGLDARERADLLRLLTEIAATGPAVLLTAREMDPADVTTLIDLGSTRAEPAVSDAESEPAAVEVEREGVESDEPETPTEVTDAGPQASESTTAPRRAESGKDAESEMSDEEGGAARDEDRPGATPPGEVAAAVTSQGESADPGTGEDEDGELGR
jgi:ABC-2 type transport system ATP-binding protein